MQSYCWGPCPAWGVDGGWGGGLDGRGKEGWGDGREKEGEIACGAACSLT